MLETIFFTAPAWVANTAVAIFYHFLIVRWRTIPRWPLDCGMTVRGRRLFGENRTVGGSLVMVLVGAAVGGFQGRPLVGLLMGSAALVGGLINSFAKRQLAIPEGGNFIPFDQLDYALATTFALSLFRLAPPGFNPPFFLAFALMFQLGVNLAAFALGFVDRFLWWRRDV